MVFYFYFYFFSFNLKKKKIRQTNRGPPRVVDETVVNRPLCKELQETGSQKIIYYIILFSWNLCELQFKTFNGHALTLSSFQISIYFCCFLHCTMHSKYVWGWAPRWSNDNKDFTLKLPFFLNTKAGTSSFINRFEIKFWMLTFF